MFQTARVGHLTHTRYEGELAVSMEQSYAIALYSGDDPSPYQIETRPALLSLLRYMKELETPHRLKSLPALQVLHDADAGKAAPGAEAERPRAIIEPETTFMDIVSTSEWIIESEQRKDVYRIDPMEPQEQALVRNAFARFFSSPSQSALA